MEKRILVIGATGALGLPVARALRRNSFKVRVMGRNGELLRKLFNETFEPSVGDAAKPSDIDRALLDCFGVHVSVAHGPTELKVVRTVAEAAQKAGVKRISYVSGTSVEEENAWFPIVGQKLRAEKVLTEGELEYTIFKPTWFMEALLNFVKNRRAVCFGRGEFTLHFLAVEDFAAIVAKAFAMDETINQSFRILGPEAISLYEAIDRCRAALHPEIEKVTNLPFWAARLVAILRRDSVMKSGVDLVRYFEQIQEGQMSPAVQSRFGVPETTLDRWLDSKRVPITSD